jgi:hypothetical protein
MEADRFTRKLMRRGLPKPGPKGGLSCFSYAKVLNESINDLIRVVFEHKHLYRLVYQDVPYRLHTTTSKSSSNKGGKCTCYRFGAAALGIRTLSEKPTPMLDLRTHNLGTPKPICFQLRKRKAIYQDSLWRYCQ